MDIGKGKLSKTKKQLICRLNNLCFGMHGHLSALLKDFHYFFYFKKRQNKKIANLYLQGVFFQLRHVIVLTRLIDQLGGYPEVLGYRNNQIDYYRLKDNSKVIANVAILDSVTNQILLLEDYLKVKEFISDQKTKEIIDEEIANVKNRIEQLSEGLTGNTIKMPNL